MSRRAVQLQVLTFVWMTVEGTVSLGTALRFESQLTVSICRDLGFTTYKTAGTAKMRGSRAGHHARLVGKNFTCALNPAASLCPSAAA